MSVIQAFFIGIVGGACIITAFMLVLGLFLLSDYLANLPGGKYP